MTELLTRPGPRRSDDPRPRPQLPLRQAVIGAVVAASVGVVVVAALVLAGWGTDSRSDVSTLTALRTVGSVWVFAHHAPLRLGSGPTALQLALTPLGLLALPVALLAHRGLRLGRALRAPGGRRHSSDVAAADSPDDGRTLLGAALRLLVAYAGCYLLLSALIVGLAGDVPLHAAPASGVAWATGTAVVAGGVGLLTGARLWPVLTMHRLPAVAPAVVRAGGAALMTIAAGGALLVAVSLALASSRAAALSHSLGPGISGGFLLALLGALYTPSAAVFGAAFAVGPGFSIGAGTSVAPTGARVGAVPSFPLLAALPQHAHVSTASLLACAAPVIGGVLAATILARAVAGPLGALAAALAVGVVAGAGLAALAALAGGSLGTGALAHIGPSPWRVGIAAAAEVAVVAAVAGVGLVTVRRYRFRRAEPADAPGPADGS